MKTSDKVVAHYQSLKSKGMISKKRHDRIRLLYGWAVAQEFRNNY